MYWLVQPYALQFNLLIYTWLFLGLYIFKIDVKVESGILGHIYHGHVSVLLQEFYLTLDCEQTILS